MNENQSINRPDSSAENQARRHDKFSQNLVGATTPDLKSSVAKQDAGREFKIVSEFKPSGDQPSAIFELTDGLKNSACENPSLIPNFASFNWLHEHPSRSQAFLSNNTYLNRWSCTKG